MPPEERRPVTEDGESVATQEPPRTYEEEVHSHDFNVTSIISVYDAAQFL